MLMDGDQWPRRTTHRLDAALEQIRLVEIVAPATGECLLHTFSLQENPIYTALSYVWGDPNITCNIVLDGRPFAVTTNLAAALRYLQQHWIQQHPGRAPESMRIWIDAVCINQDDVEERNQQVALMRRIYSQAEQTYSWLGVGNERIDLAMCALNTIAQEAANPRDDGVSAAWLDKYPFLCVQDAEKDARFGNEPGNQAWLALFDFNDLSYWKRLWIFQEVVLSQDVVFAYGNASLKFKDMMAAYKMLENLSSKACGRKPASMPEVVWRTIIINAPFIVAIGFLDSARDTATRSGTHWFHLGLCYLLVASDPRDYIYALLGVMHTEKILPDYSKTADQVFVTTVDHMIREERLFEWFLSMAGVGLYGDRSSLPSWTPDFANVANAAKAQERESFRVGAASKGCFGKGCEIARVRELTLHISGVVIDQVSTVHFAPEEKAWRDGQMYSFCTSLQAKSPNYITGIPVFEAIARVWLGTDLICTPLLAASFVVMVGLLWETDIPLLDRLSELGMEDFLSSMLSEGSLHAPDDETDGTINVPLLVSNALASLVPRLKAKRKFVFIETFEGFLGAAPKETAIGDTVCILQNCAVPVVLRKVHDHYVHVGTAYVLGVQDGEAAGMVKSGHRKVEQFQIQ